MSEKFQLKLSLGSTSEEVTISGEFSDEEWKLLWLFIEYEAEVSQTRLVQNGDWGKAKIEWNHQTGLSGEADLPPWDDVIVFIHRFRPVLLQNEKTNFYKVHNLLAKVLVDPNAREILRIQHQLYSGKSFQAQVKVLSNDVVLNSEKVLFDWLNAYENHREEQRKEFIDSLHKILTLEVSKAFFLGLLRDKMIAVSNLAKLIRVIKGIQPEGLRGKIQNQSNK